MRKQRLTTLQKEVLYVCLGIGLLLACGLWQEHHLINEHPGMIRLHIIANSDAPEDQQVKLQVRNAVLAFMDGQENLETARSYIDGHLSEMEDVAETVMEENGFGYTATAKRTVTFIPEKQYEDLTLPAGNYEALQITLGEGKGQNWWCVIFPQLCLVGEAADGEKLILKSKVKELLKDKA